MSTTSSNQRPACPLEYLTQMPPELLSVRDDLVWLCATHATDAAPLPASLRQLADKLRSVADSLVGSYDRGPVMQRVVGECAKTFGCTPGQILSRAKPAYVVTARHASMRLYSILANASSVQTAEAFGGRDHGTALNSFQRCREYLETDPEFRRRYITAAAALGLSPDAALVPHSTHNPQPNPHPKKP